MFSAQRYSTYSTSQNIGLLDLKSIKDTAIYNTVTNELKVITAELENTAKSAIQGLLPEGVSTDDVKNLIDEGVRNVKDTFTSLKNLTNFSQSDIEREIEYMLPNDPTMKNAFRSLTASCRDNALSKTPSFKNYNDTASCGTPGSGQCQTGEVRGFFNKLTGGAISEVGRTIQQMLKALITLGNLGYSGSLCKIFATIADKMPANVVQRGAASLLATFGGTGNIPAVFDITANMGNAIPSLEIPSLVSRIAQNYIQPTNVDSSTYGEHYTGLMSAFSFIDPSFGKATDSIYSIASMGVSNTGLQTVAKGFVKSMTDFSLDTVTVKEGVSSALAYIGSSSKKSSSSSLLSGLGSLFA